MEELKRNTSPRHLWMIREARDSLLKVKSFKGGNLIPLKLKVVLLGQFLKCPQGIILILCKVLGFFLTSLVFSASTFFWAPKWRKLASDQTINILYLSALLFMFDCHCISGQKQVAVRHATSGCCEIFSARLLSAIYKSTLMKSWKKYKFSARTKYAWQLVQFLIETS